MRTRQTNPAIMRGCLVAIVTFLLVLAYPVSRLHAQSSYGSIVGTVTDASGAAVPGATVSVTNTGTNETHAMKSDATGNYSFVNLLPAIYKLDIQAESFKRFQRTPIQVEVGLVVRIDAALQVGATTETVEVTTQAPLLQTETGQMSQQVEGQTVQQMPLNGRNAMNLISLTAGVVPNGGTQGTTTANQNSGNTSAAGWANYQIGGSLNGSSAEYMDGIALNMLNANAISYVPTQDFVQEFNVATNAVNAEYGRFEGGVVNMTSKSGANAWHASLYEYFRNTVLDANEWFNKQSEVSSGEANTPPTWKQNQYGAVASGPIKKDKAFFLFNWERLNLRWAIPTSTYVPTTAMKNSYQVPFRYNTSGTLINVSDPLGNCVPVKNTAGGYWDLSGCSSLFPASSRQFLNYYPDSNTGSSTAYYRDVAVGNDSSQYNARVDYNLSANQRIFGRYSYWHLKDIPSNMFPEAKYDLAAGMTVDTTHMAVLGDTYTINPTTILDVRLSWLRQLYNTVLPVTDADEAAFFPGASFISQESVDLLPQFTLSGERGFPTSWSKGGYNQEYFTNVQLGASVVKMLNRHSIKVGAELRLMNAEMSGTSSSGVFAYTGNYTGDEWSDLLLGYAQSSTIAKVNWTTAYNFYQGYYVEDTWHATQKLVLNLGLRYEFPGSQAETHDKATVLLPTAVDPNTGVRGTLGLVNSSLYGPRTIQQTEKRLIAPRLSFAYRLPSSTVVRGGYGVTYAPPDLGGGAPSTSTVNTATTTMSNSAALTPANVASGMFTLMTNPYPNGLLTPSGRSNSAFMTSRLYSTAITGPNPFDHFPYMQQWNLSFSREMKGDWMVDIGYAGSKGTHLPSLNGGLDQLPKNYWSDGNLNRTSTVTLTTPVGGYSKTVTLGQSRQPYPYYNNFTDAAPRWSSTNWHALEVKVEKRFKSGGILMGSYTWEKMLGDTDSSETSMEPKANQNTAAGFGYQQDNSNHRDAHSILSYNVPNRVVVSYVQPLPIGHGQKYLNSLNGAFDKVVTGWSINGITTFQSGYALGLLDTTTNYIVSTFGGGTKARPDLVSGCNKNMPGSTRARLGEWFNTACYQPAGTSTNTVGWALGTDPRVDGGLHSEGIDNWDMSFKKLTRITERSTFEFSGEFFNIFNRTQLAPPYTQSGSSSFGQILATANHPRLIQFSGRINF